MTNAQPLTRLTYTPAEVAEMIGATEWWVREQIRRHRIPHVRLGKGRMLLRIADVPALLDIFAVDVEPEHEEVVTAEEAVQQVADIAVVGLSKASLARRQRMAAKRGSHATAAATDTQHSLFG